jgi:hypothetical protein
MHARLASQCCCLRRRGRKDRLGRKAAGLLPGRLFAQAGAEHRQASDGGRLPGERQHFAKGEQIIAEGTVLPGIYLILTLTTSGERGQSAILDRKA